MHPVLTSVVALLRHGRLLLAVFALLAPAVPARAEVSKEYQLKAVLLFRLTQFVEWPTNRFAAPESPVIIGVIGRNPFGDALPIAVRGETANGRRIEVRQLGQVEEAIACHILYISSSEERRARQITGVLAGQAVLTVSDFDEFARDYGGMIRFRTVDNKVNLRINVARAKAAGLVLNSRLLRMAEIIESP